MRISDWSSDVCSSDLLLHQIVKRVFFTLPVEFGAELGERAQVDWTRAKQHIDFFDKARIGTGDIAVPEFVIDRSGRKSAINHRSEERRVGIECVSTCRSRCSPNHYKKTKTKQH